MASDVTLIILLVAAPIGGIDVVYFHLWKFRLYSRPQSVKEEITHLIRGLLFPLALGMLLAGRPEGLWWWAFEALFFTDAANSLIDVMVEPASRLPRIVPPTELAIHWIGTTLMGAAWAAFTFLGWGAWLLPTALSGREPGAVPDLVLQSGYLTLVSGVVLLVLEAALFAEAVYRRRVTRVAAT